MAITQSRLLSLLVAAESAHQTLQHTIQIIHQQAQFLPPPEALAAIINLTLGHTIPIQHLQTIHQERVHYNLTNRTNDRQKLRKQRQRQGQVPQAAPNPINPTSHLYPDEFTIASRATDDGSGGLNSSPDSDLTG